MKKMKLVNLAVLCFCAVIVFAGRADGVSIPLGDSGWEMVVHPGLQGVGLPVVDGVTDDAVVIELFKTFTIPPDEFGSFSPILIEFVKVSEDATQNIVIADEFIVNDTGVEWFDFHITLVVDLLDPQAGLDPAHIPDGDQLEKVSFSLAGLGYNGLPARLNFEDSDGAGVPSEPPGDDVFKPGLRLGEIVIVTSPDVPLGGRFVLKEIPTPEPATVLLLGIGGLMTVLGRKRRSA